MIKKMHNRRIRLIMSPCILRSGINSRMAPPLLIIDKKVFYSGIVSYPVQTINRGIT